MHFFSQCTIYLKIDLSSTSLRDLLNSILIELQHEKKNYNNNNNTAAKSKVSE